ncbi:SWI/SNF complex subunit SMARCC2 [Papilio xuthus]|uniref:SWI/SNF complex subunit SMARCC2 n=1 Tax=Papilio xuthus TaxID=66420 RepID=A0A194QEZ7_PAPXU|nr:SWI/SNF complex subunit SMARCC2 [Papilio xuthus]
MKVFMDMKPGGSLCTVLATMFRFKSEQRWRKFDFQVGKVCSRAHARLALTAPAAPAALQTTQLPPYCAASNTHTMTRE